MTEEKPNLEASSEDDRATKTTEETLTVGKLASSATKVAKSVVERGKEITTKGVQRVGEAASGVTKAARAAGEDVAKNLTGAVESKNNKTNRKQERIGENENKVTQSFREPFGSSVEQENSLKEDSLAAVSNEGEFPNRNSVMDDHMILWVVAVSIAVVRTMENWHAVISNSVPISVVFSYTLVAFLLGLEVDAKVLLNDLKARVLGLETREKSIVAFEPIQQHDTIPNNRTFLEQFFRRDAVRLPKLRTNLRRSRTLQERQQSFSFDSNLINRLSKRFRHNKRVESLGPPISAGGVPQSTGEDQDIGAIQGDARAQVLLQKMDFEPLFHLRGVDVFLTDCPELEMGTHPFLTKNGLREKPTFLLNIMTQWGAILVYFGMPSWVKDCNESLVEEESDAEDVKALKRFLNGDDEYRKKRLKIMPELVEAPYPVRLMAPTGIELEVQRDGLLETTYHHHDSSGDLCVVYEVALDLMVNSTMRGMASLVKSYLSRMSIDLCAIISKPKGQEKDEPEACLGLWRLHRLNVGQYPTLPDRFSTDGCSQETIHAIRATMLAKNANLESSKTIAVSA